MGNSCESRFLQVETNFEIKRDLEILGRSLEFLPQEIKLAIRRDLHKLAKKAQFLDSASEEKTWKSRFLDWIFGLFQK